MLPGMKNLYIDTNAIVSYLFERDKKQADLVDKFLLDAQNGQLTVTVIPEVIIEVMYVLQQHYNTEKCKACDLLKDFVSTSFLNVENRNTLIQSLDAHKFNSPGLLDIYLFFLAKNSNAEVFSFDKDMEKLKRRF